MNTVDLRKFELECPDANSDFWKIRISEGFIVPSKIAILNKLKKLEMKYLNWKQCSVYDSWEILHSTFIISWYSLCVNKSDVVFKQISVLSKFKTFKKHAENAESSNAHIILNHKIIDYLKISFTVFCLLIFVAIEVNSNCMFGTKIFIFNDSEVENRQWKVKKMTKTGFVSQISHSLPLFSGTF